MALRGGSGCNNIPTPPRCRDLISEESRVDTVWYVLAALFGVAGVVALSLWVHQFAAGAEVSRALVPVGAAALLLTCGCMWVAELRYGKQ